MKKLTNIIASVFIVTMLLSVFVVPASAETIRYKYANSSAFGSNEWGNVTEYKNNGVKIGQLRWGYDTDWINEDYCKTKGESSSTKATLFRYGDSTTYSGPLASVGSWSTNYSGTITDTTIYGW
ncbi:MAG: hypothetical protein ACOX45_01990 [Acutalibacteraceae bacterium]